MQIADQFTQQMAFPHKTQLAAETTAKSFSEAAQQTDPVEHEDVPREKLELALKE